MNEHFLKMPLMQTKMLDINYLIKFLKNFNDILCIESPSNSLKNDEMIYKLLPNIILKIKKLKPDVFSKLLLNTKADYAKEICNALLNVIKSNNDLLVLSEIISHGITYFDALEKLNIITKFLEELNLNPSNFIKKGENISNNVTQIILEDFKLEYLIYLIINNINKILVFTPTKLGRSVITCYILLKLLHKENHLLMKQLLFLLPEDNETFVKSDIIISQKSLSEIELSLIKNQNISIEFTKNSCFLVMDSCDIFSAVVNYLNSFGKYSFASDKPRICLIQENIFDSFYSILNTEIKKSNILDLLDQNRQLSLNYIDNIDIILELITSDRNFQVLTSLKSCDSSVNFFNIFICNQVQPQTKVFQHTYLSRFSSFILTFRSPDEGVMLANKLNRHKATVYLWTENLSQCFDMKSKLDYTEILVNTIDNSPFLGCPNRLVKCNTSLFNIKKIANINESTSSNVLPSNQINSTFDSLKTKIETRNFSEHYRQVSNIISQVRAAGMISENGSEELIQYIDQNLKGEARLTTYTTCDGPGFCNNTIHQIGETLPIGRVLIYLGESDITDRMIQLLLLSWLLGNDVVLVSMDDIDGLRHILIGIPSLRFLCGAVSMATIVRCAIDSVLVLDDLLNETPFDPLLLDTVNVQLFHKLIDSYGTIDELFDDVTPFLERRRRLLITSSAGLV